MLERVRAASGLPGAHRHPRAAPGGARRGGGRCAPDPGVPLPPDRSARRRRPHRQAGEREEGPVDAGRSHGRRGGEGAERRQHRRRGHRARHVLRLRRPRGRHAELRPAPRGDRRAGGVRRDPLGAAAGAGAGGASGGPAGAHPARCSPPRRWPAPTGSFSRPIPIRPARSSDAATQWPLDRLDELMGRTLDLWARLASRHGAGLPTDA